MQSSQIIKKLCMAGLFVAACAYAKPYVVPKNMEMFGKQYTLAFQNENSAMALYEYTTDNEPVENWSRLITLIHYKFKVDAAKFIQATKAGLDSKKIVPHYSLYQKGENGYVLLIFEPSHEHAHFEADVQKTFHPAECDGTFMLQYGIRKPVFEQLSSEEKNKMLKEIFEQLQSDAAKIAEYQWKPECK
ncbi:MAG: hypothetical protein PHV10_08255 [Sulfuricurvum sp.]|nr:hypothetical protein [Sulfuricurvum sp.]